MEPLEVAVSKWMISIPKRVTVREDTAGIERKE